MRVVVVTGHELNAQGRLFVDAVRQAGDLAGIVQVRRRQRKRRKSRARRYLDAMRRDGVLRGMNFVGGVVASALVKPRLDRKLAAALATHLDGDPTDGVPVVDGGAANSKDEVAAIRSLEPDILYNAGPGIVRAPVFEAAPRGMLHVHHGILPGLKGVASPEWAAREREPAWLGVTLHLIDAGLDTGALVAQGRPKVEPGDGWIDVRVKLSLLGARLIAEGLRALDDGLEPVAQPAGLRSEYRTTLCLTDWIAFYARRRGFLRQCCARDEEVSTGAYLPQ